METCEKHPHNYYNTINICRVAEKIRMMNNNNNIINNNNEIVNEELINNGINNEEIIVNNERNRDKERDIILSKLNDLENKIINFFNEKFKSNLKLEDHKIVLREKNIGNEELELLSHVEFKNLEEIDLSHNKISDLKPFKNFNSKKLKKIDLSFNAINNIKPLKDEVLERNVFPNI